MVVVLANTTLVDGLLLTDPSSNPLAPDETDVNKRFHSVQLRQHTPPPTLHKRTVPRGSLLTELVASEIIECIVS